MDKYHVGIRIRGFAKKYLRKIRHNLTSEDSEEKYIPHITLIPPFKTNNEERLITTFEEVCSNQKELISFSINGFGAFYNPKKIFYAVIEKNPELEKLIEAFENNLEKNVVYLKEKINPEKEKNLHLTIMQGIPPKITLTNLNSVGKIEQYLLRVYLLKNKLILKEYDFALEELLTREQAKDKEIFQKTIQAFTEKTGLIPSPQGFIKIN